MNRSTPPAPRSRAWLPRPALGAIVAALAAVAVIAALTYRALAARSEAADAVNHTNEVDDHLHRFLSSLKDAETGQRGFLPTGTEHYLDPYQLALGDIAVELATLRRLTFDNPGQQQRLDVVAPLLDAKLVELRQTIDQRRAGDVAGAIAVVQSDRGKAVMDRLRGVIDTMLVSEQALLTRRTDEWQAAVQWSSYTMLGGLALLIGMIGLIGALASRDFRAVEAEAWSRRVELALSAGLQGDRRLASIGDQALGLVVDALGARIGALYVVDGGELRRIRGGPAPDRGAEAARRRHRAPAPPPPVCSSPPGLLPMKLDSPKVMIVDDTAENLVALEALLRRDGVHPLCARSGAEALELLLAHDVAIALVDVQMPEMDGFELAELMRGAARTKHVPIVTIRLPRAAEVTEPTEPTTSRSHSHGAVSGPRAPA